MTLGALVHRRNPETVDIPWWNQKAIAYADKLLRPGDRVFEWGSGGSTAWLVQHGAVVTSIEHNAEWFANVNERCPTADIRLIPGAKHGVLRSEPEGQDKGEHFFDDYVAAIDSLADGSIDLVIIDGICRMDCVRRSAPKVRPGGVLLVDDTDMRSLNPSQLLPGWRAVRLAGFKGSLDLRETTFLHKSK